MWLVRNADAREEDAESAAEALRLGRERLDFDALDLGVKRALVKVLFRTKVDELHRYLPFGSAIMMHAAFGDLQRALLEQYHAAVDAAADADAFAALLATKLRFDPRTDAMSDTTLHAQMTWMVNDLAAILALADGIDGIKRTGAQGTEQP